MYQIILIEDIINLKTSEDYGIAKFAPKGTILKSHIGNITRAQYWLNVFKDLPCKIIEQNT